MLYFYLDNRGVISSLQLANLLDTLVPSLLRAQVHQAGVLGAISQTVNPIRPPCILVSFFAKHLSRTTQSQICPSVLSIPAGPTMSCRQSARPSSCRR